MKKFLILFLILSLVSCSQTPTQTPSEAPEKALLIFAPVDVNAPAKAFLNTAQTKTQSEDYFQALSLQLSSDTPPTLFAVQNLEQLQKLKPNLEELSGEEWVNNSAPNTLTPIDGKVYAMPATVRGIGIIYNSAVFEAAGINPENLNSPDRLLSCVSLLDAKIKNGDFKSEFPHLKSVFCIDEDFEKNFEKITKTAEQNTDVLKSLLEQHSIRDENALSDENAVMTLADTDIYYKVETQTAEKLDILPLCIEDEIEYKILIETPLMWCVNKSASFEDKKTAKEFLNWLYTKEGREHLNSARLINPITNLDNADPKLSKIHTTLKTCTDTAQTAKIK